jgi:inhibitor of cysteine peptidase
MRKSLRIIGILAVTAMMISMVAFTAFSETSTPTAKVVAMGEAVDYTAENYAADTARSDIEASIVLYVGSPMAYVGGVQTQIDPGNIEVTPVIIDNVEMVPIRFIAESLGGVVGWDQKTLTATIILGDKSYHFTQGSDKMTAGQSRLDLGAKVQSYKGRTFVPLDTFVEVLGKKAFYDRGLIIISDEENIFDPAKDKEIISGWIRKLSYLPVVESYDKLVGLLEEGRGMGGDIVKKMDENVILMEMPDMAVTQESVRANEALPSQAKTSASDGLQVVESESITGSERDDYSTTNVQIQGVDEGDIVKTDGNYIYQVNRERVVITKVDAPESMKVVSTLAFTEKNLDPQELYLHDQRLIVIGSSRAYFPVRIMKDEVQLEIYPAPRYSQESVKVLIYDMSDREDLKLLREVELEGRYVSSRKVGPALYMIANDQLSYHRIQNNEMNITPSYRDTALKEDYINIGYDSIRYFPSTVYNNYMIVAGIDVERNETANVSAYLGAGQNIYASTENLYVAVSDYSRVTGKSAREEITQLYKFAMKDAQLTYLCKGEVPGTILNQFSMDEQGNTFRIATTKGNIWATDERISKNALYVLDSMLSITGRVEDMARNPQYRLSVPNPCFPQPCRIQPVESLHPLPARAVGSPGIFLFLTKFRRCPHR